MNRRVVAGAIVDEHHHRLLLAQRERPAKVAGLWELPGGKVEPGETDAQALRRELTEELGIICTVGDQLTGEVDLGSEMVLVARYAQIESGEPSASEHRALRWVDPAELLALAQAEKMVPADTIWVGQLIAKLEQ